MPNDVAPSSLMPVSAEMLARELAESLERYRAIIDTTVDGIVTIGVDGLIQSFNRAAERLFGYRADEVIGSNVSRLMPEPYRSRHDHFIEAYLTTGTARIIGIGREVEGQRKDGTIFPMDLAVGEVQLPDRRLFTGIIRDISQRRAMEAEARRRLDELAHVSRLAAMGEMATNLAHEVNQPLTAIITHAGACLRMLASGNADPEILRDSLAQISRQGERAGAVIKRLRRFVRKGDREFSSESLNPIVRDVLWLVGHELRGQRVGVVLDLEETLPEVPMDRVQIEQVVFNLVRNAIEAMETQADDHRKLWLRTFVTEAEGQTAVAFSVRDSGPGFGAQDPQHFFEPYFTTKPTGMGQGLSICKSIIEAHGGSIAALPDGGGAHLRFTIPLGPDQ